MSVPFVSRDDLRTAALAASPDPLRTVEDQPEPSTMWIYAPGQYEAGTLERLVAEGFAANRFVHYTQNYARPVPTLTARHALTGTAGSLRLIVNGRAVIEVDGLRQDTGTNPSASTTTPVWVRIPAQAQMITVTVTSAGGPATFAVTDDAVLDPRGGWMVEGDDDADEPAQLRPGTELPPHTVGEPVHRLSVPVGDDGLVDVGATVLGRVVITAEQQPVIRSGESIAEAGSEADDAETRHDLRARPDGTWASVHQLGFRYLRVTPPVAQPVEIEVAMRPAYHRGAFVCSDPILNRIWSTSAYTLRATMHRLMLDGIKRDRMPWIGDQALATLANAYAFGDEEIVRDSLTALGSPQDGYVNGISDYSLWWIITQELHQRYFARQDHLERQADHIHRFVNDLARHTTPSGVLRPPTDPHGFGDASPGSVLIDWGVTIPAGVDYTGLQMLWFWALRSAAALLRRVGHPGAARWSALADTVQQTLQRQAWSTDRGAWTEFLDHPDRLASYPNFLAVLSGIEPPAPPEGVADAIELGRVGTPFMTAFALRALSRCGRPQVAVDRIRRQWGGMLEAGATTFWEEFDHTGDHPYSMYGRPFGKSLCHAWGAGPAAILPETVLGLRPLADGWREFGVRPELGDLDWAGAVVPVPGGDIAVVAQRDGTLQLDHPPGCTPVT